MVIYGKQHNAPGFQKVTAERQIQQELRQKHLSYSWFVKEMESQLTCYKEYLRDQPWQDWRAYRKLVWSNEKKKWTYASMNAEERLYWRLMSVGNGMKDIDDYRDVIQVASWTHESRCILEDVLSARKKALIYEFYKEEKEQNSMETEDKIIRNNSQKKVTFS